MAIAITYGILDCDRPANTAEAALYLVAAATEIDAVLRVCNQDSSARTFSIAHCKATGAADGTEWLAYEEDIDANTTIEYSICAGAAEEIRRQASIADKISFHLSGKKKVTS